LLEGSEKDLIRPSQLAFDIDGVIADTMSLFLDIARTEFDISGVQYEDISEYSLNGLGGIDEAIVVEIIKSILTGRHVGLLQPIEGAAEVLKRLNQYHKPTLFVTARPDADQIYNWIIDLLSVTPADIEIIATGSFEDKQDVLMGRDILYFVEDRLETCFILQDAGIQPIVFKQPWNRKPHPFTEVENWRQIESLIAFK